VDVVDLGCIDFTSPKAIGSIMAREYKIPLCRCLMESLEIDGSL
jgi:hypothetical protein